MISRLFLILAPTIIILIIPTTQIPLPEESSPSASSPSLKIIPDEPPSEEEDAQSKQKRNHNTTPSPTNLESRREAFIKALGGGEDSAPVLLSSLQGLGSLATDFVTLLSSNANETLAPLREAKQRARSNFPDIGTNLNQILRNGRDYSVRAYRGLAKNLRVKVTNILRFTLQAVTRLASTVGGLYQVVVSLLDVATRGIGSGARIGANLLAVGSNATVRALARGTQVVKNLADSGILVKPVNQAVVVGRGLAKGISEDLFDKVEWAQEGINSKLELAQALAPNFLLRAHENPRNQPTTNNGDTSYGPPSDEPGGYSTKADDEAALLSLASSPVEQMQRDGRGVDEGMMTEMMNTTTPTPSTTENSSTNTPKSDGIDKKNEDEANIVNQTLLNDIFGLQDEVSKLKEAIGMIGEEEDGNKNSSSSSTVKSV